MGVDLLVLLGVLRDLIVSRRVHSVYLWGRPALILAQFTIMDTVLHFWPQLRTSMGYTLCQTFSEVLMKLNWPRLAAGALALIVLTGVGGLLFFNYAQHQVARRLHAPVLEAIDLSAPDLAFHTLDGTPRHISDYKGKVIFLDLWGTWCIQCVAEMPTVQKLFDRFKDDPNMVFLIVSRMDTPETVSRYARRNKLALPFFVTRDEDIPDSMYLHQYPATFIYSKDGRIASQHAGGADWSDRSVSAYLTQLERR